VAGIGEFSCTSGAADVEDVEPAADTGCGSDQLVEFLVVGARWIGVEQRVEHCSDVARLAGWNVRR
jgi:hypothetical protein